jgi:hypothetical protein
MGLRTRPERLGDHRHRVLMFRRLFGRAAPPQPDSAAWWREANALAESPDAVRIEALRIAMCDPDEAPDIAEDQLEMIEGLERVHALRLLPALPVVATQHRVIGQATCHFLAPGSLIDPVDASGKVFATNAALVFAPGAAGAVKVWPWHTIAAVSRVERDVVVDLRGQPAAARLRMNTSGDALVMVALAERLRPNRP